MIGPPLGARGRARASSPARNAAAAIAIVAALALGSGASAGPGSPDPGPEPAPGQAQAQAQTTAPIAIAAAIRRGADPVTAAVLIGAGGQVYQPTATGWQRTALGGVAVEITGAIAGKSALIAFGRGTPLFRYAAPSWHVDPLPNRGPIAFATSGAPALAIGRHIYLLSGDRFTRVTSWPSPPRGRPQPSAPAPSAPGSITAVWAAGQTRAYAAGDGKLGRFDGKQWADVSHPLPAADAIRALVGVAGRQLIAVASSGALLDVGARTARRIPVGADLAGFRAALACPDPAGDGAIYVVGAMADRWLLARVEQGRLARVEELADPGGDPFAVFLGDPAGGLLLATRGGQVRLRAPDGRWSEATVSGQPPETPPSGGRGRPGRSH